MNDTPHPHTNGYSTSPLASVAADEPHDDRPEPADYDSGLKSVLASDPGQDRDEDEDGFGDFVYHGKDTQLSDDEEGQEYGHRLNAILGSAASTTEDGASTTGISNGGQVADTMITEVESAAPATPSGFRTPDTRSPSTEAFPGLLTPSRSITDSLASGAFPRRPAAYPQISRLRSVSTQLPAPRRFPSSSTQSAFDRRNVESPASSRFDLQSRQSSASNLPDFQFARADLLTPDPSSPTATSSASKVPSETFRWSTLRRISARVYPPISSKGGATFTGPAAPGAGLLGVPTVMAVSGVIAMGTSHGWVMVFDFGQNLRCVCGSEAIVKEAGAVTALAISQDHTFIAVGHALGSIHLYALLKPTQPARSVPPTTLPLVLTGRKEGHLVGSRILHLGFVGARHTAIVSSDETGLAFYHSLGKVLMLASTDIIRMLGRYPDPSTPPRSRTSGSPSASLSIPSPAASTSNGNASQSHKPKRPSTILDMAPLPLGPSPHSSDTLALVAMLTPTKLVVVGLKPTPRTWWRATQAKEGSAAAEMAYDRSGVLAWFPSTSMELGAKGGGAASEQGEDPRLAFAWGRSVRLVRVGLAEQSGKKGDTEVKAADGRDVDFIEEEGWSCDTPVLGLQWYNLRIILVLTAHHIDVYDVENRQQIGRDTLEIRNLVSHDYYTSAFDASRPADEVLSFAGSFRAHKRKLFLLTLSDVRVGAVLSWADRILGLMQPSTILDAIEVTTAYLLGQNDASTIILPDDPAARREIVEPKLREILTASLGFIFSEERLRDGSHNDGASMQRLLEGLVGTCVRACLATGDVEWLFDELYERYEQNGIEGIFLERIEPFVLSGSVHALPPSVSQRLISVHEERGQFEAAQRIIWHVDPEYLDINQALGLCQRQKLYDALIYVYTRSLHDFVSPIVELLALVRRIQTHREQRPRRVGDRDDTASFGTTHEEDIEGEVPDAYKIYAYLAQALAGLSYPSKEPLPYEESILARNAIYSFLFSGRTVTWPERGGSPVLTSDEDNSAELPYPYLRLLLRFDAEAMLDALDLAFEESYLEDDIPGKPLTRQRIVDLLLEVVSPASDSFTPVDRTFLHIFIARNLPKYPQFIELAPSVLHRILVGLASDPDQSTTDDRQLAAEYLLSSYTPQDSDAMVVLFEQASFFRILRSIYRGERRWAALASTYLRDPDVGADVFGFLRETLKMASRSTEDQWRELAQAVLEAVPALLQAHESGLQETADLVDTFLPTYHDDVITKLAVAPWRQFAYLRYLLEPASSDTHDSTLSSKDRTPSTRLDIPQRLLYLSLLCTYEPSHVFRYLEADPQHLANEAEALRICEQAEVFDALIWAIDQRGDTEVALDRVDATLESRTELLVNALMNAEGEEEELDEDEQDPRSLRGKSDPVDAFLEQISAISKVAVQICVARTPATKRTPDMTGEDLWFRLLSSLVATVRAIRAVAPSPPRPSDRSSSHRRISGASIIFHDADPKPLSPSASDLLSSLIPTALSSLVSTTSTRAVSFPNLMRRLIESNARSPAADRSYAEFKAIVTSMLDTYVFEGDLLALTSNISAQDLFEHVARLKRQRESGWRARGDACAECGQPVWGPEGAPGQAGKMTRSASVSMVVETLGMAGRPRLRKRPSLKGKEVEWPEAGGAAGVEKEAVLEPPKGIVLGRDGRVWHQSCHLLSTSTLSRAAAGYSWPERAA